jgi:hypothetical protein
MDFYQGVVAEYVASNRAYFVSGEFMIPRKAGGYFLVDLVAISPSEQHVYLCEVTYSQRIANIIRKVKCYHQERDDIQAQLFKIAGISTNWKLMPWLFVLAKHHKTIDARLRVECPNWHVRIDDLETVGPWNFPSGYREFVQYLPPNDGQTDTPSLA